MTIQPAQRGSKKAPNPALSLRCPTVSDGAVIHRLAEESAVLEANSLYSYLLLATHFADTCVIAELAGEAVGFVNAYRPPSHPEAVFVWQVAVRADQRGAGVGAQLLHHLVDLPACRNVAYLEATVTASNTASQHLFRGFARERGAACEVGPGFERTHFGPVGHEDEDLFRIGPLERTR